MKNSTIRSLVLLLLGILFSLVSARAELKVGVIIPTSGFAAEYGRAIINGIELAQGEQTKETSQKLHYIFEDASYDPKLAIQAFHKLVNVDQVDLLYVWGVSFCKALAPLAESHKIPMIGQCVDYESARGKNFVIRFMNPSDEYARVMSKHLELSGFNKIALIVSENAYLEELSKSYELFLGNKLIKTERVAINEKDFRSSLMRLRDSGTEALGLMLNSGQYALVAKQLAEINWAPQLFANNYLESSSEVAAASPGIYGTLIPSSSLSPEFIHKYLARFKTDGQLGFAVLAYEFARMLASIESKLASHSTPEDRILDLKQVAPVFNSAAGPYRYVQSPDYGGYFQFQLKIKQILPMNFREID